MQIHSWNLRVGMLSNKYLMNPGAQQKQQLTLFAWKIKWMQSWQDIGQAALPYRMDEEWARKKHLTRTPCLFCGYRAEWNYNLEGFNRREQ
jgi:hypothetical protein